MKKFLLAIVSLFLALSLGACLAEDADRAVLPEPQDLATLFPNDTIVTKDLGDFTISYPESMRFDPEEEVRAGLWNLITLYEGVGSNNLLNIARMDQQAAFDDTYVAAVAEYVLDSLKGMKEYFSQLGVSMQYTLVSSAAVDFGGCQAAYIIWSTGLDGFEEQTYYAELYVPLGEKGTYTFSITSGNLSENVVLSSILNTVKWKE